MTGPRVQVNTGLEPEGFQPQARPTERFVRPQRDTSIARLAESLRGLSEPLAQFSDVLHERRVRRDTAQGAQEARQALEEGAKSFNDAIKQGLISPDQSPFFRQGAKELFGRVTADRFNTALQHAIATDPRINSSTDPEDFDAFVADFQAEWLAEHVTDADRDLQFEAGFGPRNDAYIQNARAAFGAQSGGRLMEQVRDNVFAEIGGVFQDQIENGLPTEEVERAVKLTMERARVMGLPARQANRIVAEAVIAEAVARADTSILDTLNNIQAGSGPLGGVRDVKQAVEQARSQIISRKQGEARYAEWERQLEVRADVQDRTNTIVQQLLDASNPATVNIDQAVSELAEIDTAAALNLFAVQERLVTGSLTPNPALVEDLVVQVYAEPQRLEDGTLNPSYVDVGTLTGLMGNGLMDLRNFESIQRHINNRDQVSRDPRVASFDREFERAVNNMQARFKTGLFGNFASPAAATAANRAEFAFRERFLMHKAREGFLDTDPRDFNTWLSDNSDNLFDTFNKGLLEATTALNDAIPEAMDWRAVPVVGLTDLAGIEQEILDGTPTDATMDLLESFGVDTADPNQIAEFLAVQSGLLQNIGR